MCGSFSVASHTPLVAFTSQLRGRLASSSAAARQLAPALVRPLLGDFGDNLVVRLRIPLWLLKDKGLPRPLGLPPNSAVGAVRRLVALLAADVAPVDGGAWTGGWGRVRGGGGVRTRSREARAATHRLAGGACGASPWCLRRRLTTHDDVTCVKRRRCQQGPEATLCSDLPPRDAVTPAVTRHRRARTQSRWRVRRGACALVSCVTGKVEEQTGARTSVGTGSAGKQQRAWAVRASLMKSSDAGWNSGSATGLTLSTWHTPRSSARSLAVAERNGGQAGGAAVPLPGEQGHHRCVAWLRSVAGRSQGGRRSPLLCLS